MTAYRQQALACAALLQAGPGRPRDLRVVAPEAGRILQRNVYVWFERTERGVYRLNSLGQAALQRWPQTIHLPRGDLPQGGTDGSALADGELCRTHLLGAQTCPHALILPRSTVDCPHRSATYQIPVQVNGGFGWEAAGVAEFDDPVP